VTMGPLLHAYPLTVIWCCTQPICCRVHCECTHCFVPWLLQGVFYLAPEFPNQQAKTAVGELLMPAAAHLQNLRCPAHLRAQSVRTCCRVCQ
jgi:hypothetical protein